GDLGRAAFLRVEEVVARVEGPADEHFGDVDLVDRVLRLGGEHLDVDDVRPAELVADRGLEAGREALAQAEAGAQLQPLERRLLPAVPEQREGRHEVGAEEGRIDEAERAALRQLSDRAAAVEDAAAAEEIALARAGRDAQPLVRAPARLE